MNRKLGYNMKVTIIIPLYNTRKYIARCIESCLNQSYKDIEIIIINDGSTDGSELIAKDYERRFNFIKVIDTDNRGLSAARNLGLDYARGKYVYFLDSDDWIENRCLELCVYYADKNELEIVAFDANVILEENADPCYQFNSYDRRGKIIALNVQSGYEYVEGFEKKPINIQAWNVFTNREFLLKNRIQFLEGAYYEDIKFHFDCMLKVTRIMYIPFLLYNRSYREDSIVTSKLNVKKLQSICSIVDGVLGSVDTYVGGDKKFWLDYAFHLICNGYVFAFKQVCFQNISNFQKNWAVVGNQIIENIKLYFELATQQDNSINVYEKCLYLTYVILKKFDFCPQEIIDLLQEFEEYKNAIIKNKLCKLTLTDSQKKIGIYGVGKHTDFIWDFYQKHIGDILCEIVFLDSNKRSFAEKKNGYDIVNIKDAEELGLDEIIISSYQYEEEMYVKAREVIGISIPISTIYQGDKQKFPLDKTFEYKTKLDALPTEIITEKRVFLINIPKHTNVGDYMITLAEEEFLRKHFPNYDITEFSGLDYAHNKEMLLKQVRMTDVICITGGGFLGNLWFSGSNVNDMLLNFKDNKIVIFPQSIYFKEDENKENEIKQLYIKLLQCADVTVCLREQKSFNYTNKIFDNHVKTYLMPDIVLSLEKSEKQSIRDGILLCLRNDRESIISDAEKFAIWDKVQKISDKISFTSMHWHEVVDNDAKEVVIEKKLQEFRNAELVITDTLHCMISCIITGTPCIAINNLTGKVKGVYEWVKHLDYIYCVEGVDEFLNINISEWKEIDQNRVYISVFNEYEEGLKNLI